VEGERLVRDEITRNLQMIYQDDEIDVYTAPTEDELKNIIMELLDKHGRMTIRDLHRFLSGLASEDKIRYALNELIKENKVAADRQGYFWPAELDEYGVEYFDYEYGGGYDGADAYL